MENKKPFVVAIEERYVTQCIVWADTAEAAGNKAAELCSEDIIPCNEPEYYSTRLIEAEAITEKNQTLLDILKHYGNEGVQ